MGLVMLLLQTLLRQELPGKEQGNRLHALAEQTSLYGSAAWSTSTSFAPHAKTSIENPLLAPSGHGRRKTFLVIDEGYLDNQEGYWVEDEEDGTEGLLEADEDSFWVYA
ncbi:hypothetical protein AK812_SmicGene32209 [Symbiodinium microadriaticum]|uniref:Uncharacterized protein n=1 Tax=Symbiodinium microadriaticum TaxID=2951 RepID=A0A1Q9CUT4_SYMMI|nr:hypothetical protein AK812_SmicGene32209 [Symbiodinium microadriaticum]